MKTFSISIPKPCHEDWNKMTPDAKGAFCASCQKSVYDFSKKTDEEIIEVFEKEEKGKVCGRFTPAQLSRPVVSFGNQTTTSMLAKFAYALLLVFGATLFSGEAFGQERIKGEVKMMGKPSFERLTIEEEVEIADTVKPEETTTTTMRGKRPVTCGLAFREVKEVNLTSLGQAIVIEEPVHILMGDTIVMEDQTIETLTVDTTEMITGEIAYPEPMGLIEYIEPIDTTEIEIVPPPEYTNYIAGGALYVQVSSIIEPVVVEVEESTNENTEVNEHTEMIVEENDLLPSNEETEDKTGLSAETIIVPPTDLLVKVSPNPSRGEITLTYTLEMNSAVKIDLYDVTGKKVRALSELGRQYAGKYNVSYNISDLPNGIYMAALSTDGNMISAKVILTK